MGGVADAGHASVPPVGGATPGRVPGPCAAPQQCGGSHDGPDLGHRCAQAPDELCRDGHDCGRPDGRQSRDTDGCAPPTVQHGVQAGEGGAFSDSVPALAAGAVFIAAACGGAGYRLYGLRRSTDGPPSEV
ncbi:hypothetical protein [Streptomyces sp. NPDC046759]|uniref:hypothetical protein n=1 Tax=Streptomyces sp. NPDC046759 TaxID=3155019 RepID=UPI0033D29775